jgi:lipopolysaccharide biosynthesis glycosyltransferase
MEEKINILLACDGRIAQYLPVLIVSVLENHPGIQVDFYLMHSGSIDNDERDFIEQTVRKYDDASLQEIIMSSDLYSVFAQVGSSAYKRRWPIESFYYLLAHKVLPNSLDRILYLDVDTIVNGDIRPFYFSDFDGRPIAVVEIRKLRNVKIANSERVSDVAYISKERFNSGVILINLRYFRKYVTQQFYERVINSYKARDKLDELFADQGVVNAAFHMDALYVDAKYHCIDKHNYDSVIFHAGGHNIKPWNKRLSGQDAISAESNIDSIMYHMNGIWWKFAEKAPNFELLLDQAQVES